MKNVINLKVCVYPESHFSSKYSYEKALKIFNALKEHNIIFLEGKDSYDNLYVMLEIRSIEQYKNIYNQLKKDCFDESLELKLFDIETFTIKEEESGLE